MEVDAHCKNLRQEPGQADGMGGGGARSFQQGLNWARRVGNGVLLTWGTEDSSVEKAEKAERIKSRRTQVQNT